MSLSLPLADADLAQAAAALADWRSTTPRAHAVPRFWSRAVELAATHGVAKVARTLRLDYTALKRRVTATAEPSAPEPAAFVEVNLGLPVLRSRIACWRCPTARGERYASSGTRRLRPRSPR